MTRPLALAALFLFPPCGAVTLPVLRRQIEEWATEGTAAAP